MAKAKAVSDSEGRFYGIGFECPGCRLHTGMSGGHVLPVDWLPEGQEASPHAVRMYRWGFNGDMERPTFSPSVLTTMPVNDRQAFTCHKFIRDGRIEFLSDCSHALAGQTVELPNLNEGEGEGQSLEG